MTDLVFWIVAMLPAIVLHLVLVRCVARVQSRADVLARLEAETVRVRTAVGPAAFSLLTNARRLS